MNKPPDETLKQGRNRSWLLVKRSIWHLIRAAGPLKDSHPHHHPSESHSQAANVVALT